MKRILSFLLVGMTFANDLFAVLDFDPETKYRMECKIFPGGSVALVNFMVLLHTSIMSTEMFRQPMHGGISARKRKVIRLLMLLPDNTLLTTVNVFRV